MCSMELPNIEFSSWHKWKERKYVKNSDYPGVYLLAKYESVPSGHACWVDQNVIYIGETCNNSLQGRWRQFDRSAFQAKSGHSGGTTYNKTFGDKGFDLYVAALPVADLDQNLRPVFIRFVERRLILDFTVKWGKPPICNRK
jgi:hypothetical protein